MIKNRVVKTTKKQLRQFRITELEYKIEFNVALPEEIRELNELKQEVIEEEAKNE
jgi:tRNA uridine 5-carbamoylmethylation protein Kti12